jgi:hypothetical protein
LTDGAELVEDEVGVVGVLPSWLASQLGSPGWISPPPSLVSMLLESAVVLVRVKSIKQNKNRLEAIAIVPKEGFYWIVVVCLRHYRTEQAEQTDMQRCSPCRQSQPIGC